jgi:hypothetical protein
MADILNDDKLYLQLPLPLNYFIQAIMLFDCLHITLEGRKLLHHPY